MLVCQPYREDKNLGKAYNEAFDLIGDDDYLLITDYDVLFLLPETISHITEYTRRFQADLFVCYTNRIYPHGPQIYRGLNEDSDIKNHIQISKDCTRNLYYVTRLQENISGFLMVIPKSTWNEIKFKEDKCLGIDTQFSKDLLNAGKIILRMEGVYVWHTYRLHDIKDKTHLL